MGGGLLQLVAYGAQDAYITGNPHITFWKVMYKRHTNFAMEAMRVNFTGSPTYGQRSVVVVNRNADLMFRTYLEVTLPDTRLAATGASISGVTATSVPNTSTAGVLWSAGGRRRLGYLLIQQVEIEIGGQIMDRHYGEWMYLWESLTSPYDQSVRLDQMLGANVAGTYSTPAGCNGRPAVLYIPLSFWFCRNPGLALPLIALQYHEVRLNFIFRQATDLVQNIYGYDANGNAQYWPGGIAAAAAALPRFKDAAVYVDYIYLDTDERRRFAQQTHEYLIDQLQYGLQQSITSQTVRLDLTLNHPVKELVWVYQDARMLDCSQIGTAFGTVPAAANTQPFQYADIANRCRLQLNGQDRFDERYGDYFWKVQPYQHHSGGAFEVHAQTQLPLTGSTPGSISVWFTASTVANAGTSLGTVAITGGSTYANLAGLTLQIVSATNSSGLTLIAPGTGVTFSSATSATLAANSLATPSGGAAGTIYAIYDPNYIVNDPINAGGYAQAGFQQQQNSAYTVNQATNAFLPAFTQSINPINMYSFSLAPEEHQPSGSCNFSRIDTTTLVFDSITGADGKALSAGQFPSKQYPYLFRMYAVNYNIFRVMSGMGGLAYSN
jgi:Major capsid protein N-terminus/Large eukaryotic DNA virus major capsid protein